MKHDCDILGYCPFDTVDESETEDCDEPNYYPDESMQNYPD